MLNAICAECHKLALYAECHFVECCYDECHYAECRMLNVVAPNVNHACIIMQETGNIFSDDESETKK